MKKKNYSVSLGLHALNTFKLMQKLFQCRPGIDSSSPTEVKMAPYATCAHLNLQRKRREMEDIGKSTSRFWKREFPDFANDVQSKRVKRKSVSSVSYCTETITANVAKSSGEEMDIWRSFFSSNYRKWREKVPQWNTWWSNSLSMKTPWSYTASAAAILDDYSELTTKLT